MLISLFWGGKKGKVDVAIWRLSFRTRKNFLLLPPMIYLSKRISISDTVLTFPSHHKYFTVRAAYCAIINVDINNNWAISAIIRVYTFIFGKPITLFALIIVINLFSG